MDEITIDVFKRYLDLSFNAFREEMAKHPDCATLPLEEWWEQFNCFNYEG